MGKQRVFWKGILVVGLVASLGTFALAAQQSANENQGATSGQNQAATAPGAAQAQTPSSQMAQGMSLTRTSQLLGKQVKTSQGDTLGVVHDIVTSPDFQQVSYVALSPGAAGGASAGAGSKLYAIPWQALKVSSTGDITTSITKDQLNQSSGFTSTSWPSQGDMRLLSAGAGAAGSSAASSSTPGASTSGSAAAGQAGASRAATAPGQTPGASAGQMAMGGQDVQMRRITHLTGMEVANPEKQDLGTIEDFVVNASDGRIIYDIIAFGGAAGAGEKFAAVPANAVRIQPQTHVALLNATMDTLNSVAMSPDQLSQLSNPQTMQRLSKLFPAAPAGGALGYVPSQSPQTQQIADQTAWGPDSAHAKSFNAGAVKTIQGTVQSVGAFKPEGATAGFTKGLRLRVKTSDGNIVTVHAGPTSFAEQHNFTVRPGDQITIMGSESKSGNRTVIVASELRKGNQTLELRDKSGKPLWAMGAGGASAMPGSQSARPGAAQKSGAAGQNRPGQ